MFLILAGFSCFPKTKNQSKLPNVVFILADDIGQGDVGFYHKERTGKEPVIPTPNLERLIASGIRFNDAHTVSALCSPTRYSVMTGNYTFRCYKPWGVWNACAKSAVGEGELQFLYQLSALPVTFNIKIVEIHTVI